MRDVGLTNVAMNLRGKLVRNFQMQSRISPESLLPGKARGLNLHNLMELYGNFDDSDVIAARVLKKWDRDRSGFISLAELRRARSRTDAKLSLGVLDPGAGGGLPKMC